ncbi:MAG: LysE family transporter [Flammeovirgaceae bacterium]|nr:LysE family transporter [Flammeovirgaceae bacterium]
MLEIIINGLKLGIVLIFLVGPVFFTIIQTSVERGFWSGVVVSLGVSVSDILYVTICYFGLVQFINKPEFSVVPGAGEGRS